MRGARKRRDGQRGAAIVEFALVLPLLLTLVLGAIDWGWYFFIDQLVTNAAREGARAGTMLPPTSSDSDATAAATGASNNYLTSVQLKATGVAATTVTVTTAGGSTKAVQVTITYPVGSLTGFMPPALLPVNAVGLSVMRRQ